MASFPPKPVPKTPPPSPETSPPAAATPPLLRPNVDHREASASSATGASAPPLPPVINREHEEWNGHPSEAPVEASRQGDGQRVKVYELIGGKWEDRGIAYCKGTYDEETDVALLIARSEADGSELLKNRVHSQETYERQQATLIVWTELDGADFALSFQDPEGCEDIWEFICQVQDHLGARPDEGDGTPNFSPPTSPPARNAHSLTSSPTSLTSSPERLGSLGPLNNHPVNKMVTDIMQHTRLPTPTFSNIADIERTFKYVGRTAAGKEKICQCLMAQDYFKALIDVHEQAEDLEGLEELHALCQLMQTILLLNDAGIYDYILQDDVFQGIVGILEYDPEFPSLKAGYREFLSTVSHYKQVVNFKDAIVVRKIHHTYRLQYLKDVVLARILDDPMFNVLNSCIIFNQVDIINHIQSDEEFMNEMFGMFEDDQGQIVKQDPIPKPAWVTHPKSPTPPPSAPPVPSAATDSTGAPPTPDPSAPKPTSPKSQSKTPPSSLTPSPELTYARRRDVIFLIHQLCMMGKNIQLPARLQLYRRLVDRGLLRPIEWALRTTDQQMLNAAGEVLTLIIDHDAQGVRQFILRQFNMAEASGNTTAKHTNLLTAIERLLSAIGGDLALKSQMADSLRMLVELPGNDSPLPPEAIQRAREDPIMEKFLVHFYDSCISGFFKPILELAEFQLASKNPPTLPKPYVLPKAQVSHILYLCDLLSAFVVQHGFRSSYFVLSSSIAARMGTLLLVREKYLRLAALRFFRALLKVNNNFIHRHMIKHELYLPILELASKEAKKNSLIGACCQEFFDYLRKDNIKVVVDHVMKEYEARVRDLSESPTPMGRMMKVIILRWEQNHEAQRIERMPTEILSAADRGWGEGRMQDEEDDYFNASDDEEEATPPGAASASNGPVLPPGKMLKRKEVRINAMDRTTSSRRLPLVDYDEADGDEDMDKPDLGEGSSKGVPASGRPASPISSTPPIIRPRPIHTNGLKAGTPGEPTSPGLDAPPNARSHQSPPRPSLPDSPPLVGPSRNGTRTPSPPLSAKRRTSPPPSPRATTSSPSSPPRLSDKRKRDDDDDDDDLLGSLSRGAKRRSLEMSGTVASETKSPLAKPASLSGLKEDSSKKIKLNLTKSSIITASPIPPAPPPTSSPPPATDNG